MRSACARVSRICCKCVLDMLDDTPGYQGIIVAAGGSLQTPPAAARQPHPAVHQQYRHQAATDCATAAAAPRAEQPAARAAATRIVIGVGRHRDTAEILDHEGSRRWIVVWAVALDEQLVAGMAFVEPLLIGHVPGRRAV